VWKSAGVINEIVLDYFRSKIPCIISGKNVFKCDETGLLYWAIPDKTLAEKGNVVQGEKYLETKQ